MKKKIFLMLTVMAIIVCALAISVNAEVSIDRVNDLTMGMTTVTLSDGSVRDLYDSEGNTLCYYKDPETSELACVKTSDLVISTDANGKLTKIALSNGTVLSTTASQNANKIVVLNLRETNITDFANDNMFKNANNGLQYIFMPDSITNLIGYAFGLNNTLRGCYFSEESQLTAIAGSTFVGCTNLSAFYLPSSVTSLGNSAFSRCENVYFINNYSEFGTKPSVYYFPQGITELIGETLKFCYNINETLVFGKKLTAIENRWALAFNNSIPRNVVFLGEFTSFAVSDQVKSTTFYFANTNTPSLTVTNNVASNNNKFYFCSSETTQHLTERVEVTSATCTTDEARVSYCFCGAEVSKVTVEGTAGHNLVTYVGIIYDNYLSDGYYGYACENCEYVGSKGQTAPALFVWKGYSRTESALGGTYSVAQCFYVNKTAVEAYTSQEGKSFSFGVLAAGNVEGKEISPELGGNVQYKEFASLIHDYFEIKVNGITTEFFATKLVFCAYVIDGEDMYYLDDNATKTALYGKSYSDLKG